MPVSAKFDHYEVLTRDDGSLFELGRGAMGITYKAFDTNLRFPVALKVINAANLDDELAAQRFVSEARAAALLRHRHVASVFHLGVEGDAYYYAMEYIDGETVDALVKREGAISPRLGLQLVIQVARALNAAQKHQLVHRDIKPSNLMLVHEDDELCVKVIDFGLAKTNRRDGAEETAATTIAGFVGTPHFASPEQLDEKEIDVRSDIYSLGATLWFMLTGHPPFSGSLAQVISSQLHDPPPFSELAGVPEPVIAVLRQMLDKDAARRPQTPLDLRRDLEAALAGLSSEGAEPGIDAQEVATILENDAIRDSERPFATGALVAGRYQILEDLGEGATGDLFKAQNRETGKPVRLIVVTPALIETPEAYTALEREVDKLYSAASPNLLAVQSMERIDEHTILVEEWTSGFSLVDLLRARRELDPVDALPLLKQIAAGADDANNKKLGRLDFALHSILIDFPALPDSESAQNLMRRPVAEWPQFTVKLNPIGFAGNLSLSDTWAGGQTIVGGSAQPVGRAAGDLSSGYVQALGAVAYELLGGKPSSRAGTASAGTRYIPLATLSEEGNAVLKRACDASSSYRTSGEFYEALASVERLAPKPSPARAFATGFNPLANVAAAAEQGAQEQAAVRSTVPPIPRAAHRKPSLIIAAVAGVALLLAALGFFLLPLFTRKAPGKAEPARNLAVASPSLPTPAPTTPATPAPQPTPSAAPTPTRQDLLRQAVHEAQEFETAGNWRSTLAAYLAIARDYPESDIGRVRLEMILEQLRTGDHALKLEDLRQLREEITEAAKLDVVAAMMLLGQMLRYEEPAEAFDWYCAAAARGRAAAFTQVGLMYSNGAGGVPKSLDKALWWFQQAADRDDPAGMTCLAECYLKGKGVAKDPPKAAALLEKSVALGDRNAMDLLGTMYHQGNGVPKNFLEAFRLFTEAIQRGHIDALGNLGVLYFNGDGVPRDPRKAVSLFEKGSQQGSPACMYLYARSLEQGTGTENKQKATAWYKKAAEAGHPGALEWCRQNGVLVEKGSESTRPPSG